MANKYNNEVYFSMLDDDECPCKNCYHRLSLDAIYPFIRKEIADGLVYYDYACGCRMVHMFDCETGYKSNERCVKKVNCLRDQYAKLLQERTQELQEEEHTEND